MSNSTFDKTYAFFETPQNKKLAVHLTKSSAKFLLFPPIAAEKNNLNAGLITLLKKIDNFDWLIFTDVLAVDCFFEFLTKNDIDYFELDALRVCAFGESVADRLRFVQIHADLIPNNLTANSVLSNISDYVGENYLSGLKFIIVKENSADVAVGELLKKSGAKVSELPIYQAKIEDQKEITKLKTLLKGGAIDEFIFSSPEDLIALKHYFSDENLENIFDEIKVSAIDSNIFQLLKENNLKPHYYLLK